MVNLLKLISNEFSKQIFNAYIEFFNSFSDLLKKNIEVFKE